MLNFLRRFWCYLRVNCYHVNYAFLLSCRDFQILRMNQQLDREIARRENLERILSTSISDRLDHANCRVLKRNDA